MKYGTHVVVSFSVSCILAVGSLLADDSNSINRPPNWLPSYEIIRSDSAWCGPRLLYFFSEYFDRNHSLNEVIELCHADSSGFVSLEMIVQAAKAIGLEPIALECTADQIVDSRGPALVVVKSGTTSHLLGLIGSNGNEIMVVDPSRPANLSPLRIDEFRKIFTGYAVILKGAHFSQPSISVWEILVSVVGIVSAILLPFVMRIDKQSAAKETTNNP